MPRAKGSRSSTSSRADPSGRLGLNAWGADFSPAGDRVAVGGQDGEVVVLDVATGEPLGPPVVGHDGNVVHLAYASDGATFVSGSVDGRVGLWDGRTGALLGTAHTSGPELTFPEFLADDHTVLIAALDGAVHTWDLSLDHWVDFACSVASRNLTRDEWRTAFGDRPYRETCPT